MVVHSRRYQKKLAVIATTVLLVKVYLWEHIVLAAFL